MTPTADYGARPPRVTAREWQAISEAIGFRLAGEMEEGTDPDALLSAQRKVWARLSRPMTDEEWRPFADALGIDPLPPNDGSRAGPRKGRRAASEVPFDSAPRPPKGSP